MHTFFCHPPFVGDLGAKAIRDLLLVLLNQKCKSERLVIVEGTPDR